MSQKCIIQDLTLSFLTLSFQIWTMGTSNNTAQFSIIAPYDLNAANSKIMWEYKLLTAFFLAGYLVGLLLRPRYGVALTIANLLGGFVYIRFFKPEVMLYIAFFGLFYAFVYCAGIFIGVLARWLAKKTGKVYAGIVTVAVLASSFFYVDNRITHLKQLKVDEKRERKLILNFVKNQPEVMAMAGEKFEVYPGSCTMKNNGNLPFRCEVSVRGEKNFYVIVNISRLSKKPTFALACITFIPPGQRESFKDVCNQ